MRTTRAMALGVTMSLMSLGLAACGSGAGKSDPIVIGSINTLSGQATFPEASQAAKAVFDRVNAKGGIGGRKIKYDILDDKQDPATAVQSARKLVNQNKAVALAGSASLLDCQVNGAFYQQTKISSVPGTGVDPGCFASKAIAPVNTGPYVGTQIILQYGSEQLKLKKICAFFTIIGGTQKAYSKAVSDWSSSTGKKVVFQDNSVAPSTTDYSPFVLRAKKAGCDGIFFNGTEPLDVGWAKAMAAQGLDNVTFLTLSSVYTAQAAKAIGDPGFPMYSASEFAPYTDSSDKANADWRSLMTSKKIPITSFSQGGYLSATYLVQVLKSIKGDITRDSVTKALTSMKPINNDMVGSPWVFGNGATHAPNQTVKVVGLKKGQWSVADPQWVKAGS